MISRSRRLAARLLPESRAARALTYASLATSTGRGLFVTASVVFFHRSVGLSAVQVGAGMTVAAVVALFAGVPMGHLADRIGPRNLTVGFGVAGAVAVCCYFVVTSWAAFTVVASVAAFLQAGSQASRGALIAGSVPAEQRVRTRAYLRAVTNLGWTIGAPPAGVALWYDDRSVYLGLIAASAAAALLGAGLTLRVPAPPPSGSDGREPISAALRDRPYLTLTALNAILQVHYGIQTVALPLWVVAGTRAPVWVVAALTVVNTSLVVLLQVRASRGSDTIHGAARAQRRAGLLLLAACALYALASGPGPWMATVVLLAGGTVHVFGELAQAAGGWGLSYDLAPAHAQGQYQGLYGTGLQAADVIAPAVLTVTVIDWGMPGWLLFGAVFALTGLAVPPVAARAGRRIAARPVPAA